MSRSQVAAPLVIPALRQSKADDILRVVSHKLRDLAEIWEHSQSPWDKSPTHCNGLFDMYENLSPKNGTPLPAKLPASWRPPPGLPVDPCVTPKMFQKRTDRFYDASSEVSTCENTPMTPFRAQVVRL